MIIFNMVPTGNQVRPGLYTRAKYPPGDPEGRVFFRPSGGLWLHHDRGRPLKGGLNLRGLWGLRVEVFWVLGFGDLGGLAVWG